MRKWLFAGSVCFVFAGCLPTASEEVVVYTALDREFSEPIFKGFERETGIVVLPKYDVESTKTVGLVNAIIQESQRPRCDLFWNNEILHTLRLQKLGLLDVYQGSSAVPFPSQYKADDGTWHGLAARARVLIVNTDLVALSNMPDSVEDLADPSWKGQVGIAKPLFGSTATHAAVLFQSWGDDQARDYFQRVKVNTRVMSGNKQVAQAVASGEIAFGITDTDDAVIERDRGLPVKIVFPDQGENGMGTLFIPNTLALIKGSANDENSRRLIEYLLSPSVERRLATGSSAQFPLNAEVTTKSRVEPEEPLKHMAADFDAAADGWEASSSVLRSIFNTH